jgi:hypothetical protein
VNAVTFKGKPYDLVPEIITREVPEFVLAPEYERLTESERRISGLVFGALSNVIHRLELSREETSLTEDQEALIQKGLAIVDALASNSDPEMQNLVVTEFLENIPADTALDRILSSLGNSAAHAPARRSTPRPFPIARLPDCPTVPYHS